MMRSLQHSQSGLTLIELMVATLLMAIVGVMGYRGLSAVQMSQQHLTEVAERWQTINAAIDRLGRDLRRAGLTPGTTAEGRGQPAFFARKPANGDTESPFFFQTRQATSETGARRQAYRWRNGKLELLIWPAPEARADLTITAYTVLDRVRSIDLKYLDESGRWSDEWPVPGSRTLPLAVRVQLTLEEGPLVERLFDLP